MGTKMLRVLEPAEVAELGIYEPKTAPVARSDAPEGTDWTCGSCGVVLFKQIGKGGIRFHAAIRCPTCKALVSGDARDLN